MSSQPCKLSWQRSDLNCVEAVKVDFNLLWNCDREREDVFKVSCLYFDGKYWGRKWKTSITSLESHRWIFCDISNTDLIMCYQLNYAFWISNVLCRSSDNDETIQSDSRKEENFRAWRLWKDLCELVHLLQEGNESAMEEMSAYAKKKRQNKIFLKKAEHMGFPYSQKSKSSVNKVAISQAMKSGHIKCIYGS